MNTILSNIVTQDNYAILLLFIIAFCLATKFVTRNNVHVKIVGLMFTLLGVVILVGTIKVSIPYIKNDINAKINSEISNTIGSLGDGSNFNINNSGIKNLKSQINGLFEIPNL